MTHMIWEKLASDTCRSFQKVLGPHKGRVLDGVGKE